MKEDSLPTTAVELLALLKEHRGVLSQLQADFAESPLKGDASEIGYQTQEIHFISKKLDEMCEKAGIYLQESGYFRYQKYDFDYIGHGRDTFKMACLRDCSAREQQALQEWLLIKEENGK